MQTYKAHWAGGDEITPDPAVRDPKQDDRAEETVGSMRSMNTWVLLTSALREERTQTSARGHP